MLAIITSSTVYAQKVLKVTPSGNTMVIKGTSNLHEWESKAQQITGEISAKMDNNSVQSIPSVTINVPVAFIKSGKGIMDNKTYDALKKDKFPNISFRSTSVSVASGNTLNAVGKMTIGGVTKDAVLRTTYSVNPDGTLKVKGGTTLKMSDFDINPPTALMGTLKTGNVVDIQFEVSFK